MSVLPKNAHADTRGARPTGTASRRAALDRFRWLETRRPWSRGPGDHAAPLAWLALRHQRLARESLGLEAGDATRGDDLRATLPHFHGSASRLTLPPLRTTATRFSPVSARPSVPSS